MQLGIFILDLLELSFEVNDLGQLLLEVLLE